MNIFYLDKDPTTCAKYHADKHVVKMILESAQILCTVINEKAGYQVTPYKSTHRNHPCTIWAGQCFENAEWLLDLTHSLNTEFMYRFNHTASHKSLQMLDDIAMGRLIRLHLPKLGGTTPPALAMPEEYRSDNTVESYRLYYRLDKQHLLKYSKREKPEWLGE
jgi:hypothetical protein